MALCALYPHRLGLAREVPAPPPARGVRQASGRLTRSGRRHDGTERGFETGLRAVSSNMARGVRSEALRALYPRRPGAWRPTDLRSVNTEWTETRWHGGGFEAGLRAVSSTFCQLWNGVFTTEHTETPFGRHGRGLKKNVLRTNRPLSPIQIRHEVIGMYASSLSKLLRVFVSPSTPC